ncbi:MAG: alpha-rhamnosidase, partial [Prevotella sp.]|nr:alpha-rhamnosidase [Prevotella sp.]
MTDKATWIWYPGDFEVWLGNIFNNRRTERGAMFPPFWKQDSHYATVEFSTKVCTEREETISVWAEGEFNFMLDGKLLSELSAPQNTFWHEEGDDVWRIRIPAGKHALNFKVWCQALPPALYVDGPTIKSGSHWLATYEDKIWIDENGVAHGSGIYVPAGSWAFDKPGLPPTYYTLEFREAQPLSCCEAGNGRLYDFGRETFGHLDFRNAAGSGTAHIYYGESREEALDKEHCETLDAIVFSNGRPQSSLGSKAFRYVYIEDSDHIQYELAMHEEYAPFDEMHSGSFRCSDELLNNIWQTAARTLELTTQEFFMDGIKRDRWTWSGDAIQSYLMNYYLHFDTECVKRTIRQLRGKDPVTAHVNTIMDYTFYWFKSILDYYDYTADVAFVREMWPRMVTLMDYCLARTNQDGLMEGQPDDWIFVDWVDFPMHKRGTLAFEQLLFCKALDTMATCQQLLSPCQPPSPACPVSRGIAS